MINKQTIRSGFLKVKPLDIMWMKLSWWRTKFLMKFYPRIIANAPYKSILKKNINWETPVDLIEKTQWLQIYSDTSLWTRCADKYLVRDFVKEKGCADVLNELYGKWDDANDIDWSKLPNSFVLKANHSCGQVILVKDKNKLDINHTIKQLNSWMKTVYGYSGAQLHYTKIKPCIIAEKLFINKTEPDKSLIDYKVWCFHGEPHYVEVIFNRTAHKYSESLYDLDWNNISDLAYNKETTPNTGAEMAKPLSFDKMIETAKILSKDIPQVRVDFYDIDDKTVFGEMTFTAGGYGEYTEEFYNHLGSKIDLNKVKKLPKPNTI